MKRKIDFRIPIIIILVVILSIMCYFYIKNSTEQDIDDYGMVGDFEYMYESNIQNNKQNQNVSVITTTCEVSSALNDKLELHATYYLEECYVQTNQLIKSGENILKYTNGKYLVAPYDCVITKINIPSNSSKVTNEHYIELSSANNLMVELKVDETKISALNIGKEATIQIEAYESKLFTGNVTNISNIASNGKFTVKIEFAGDGEVRLGMTANVTI